MVAVSAMLFVLGAFIESLALLLILVPMLVPVALSLGIDPVHFGIVVVMNLMVSILTPPMGGRCSSWRRSATYPWSG